MEKKTYSHSEFIGDKASLLSLIEIGLGSILHGLKVPFSGMLLSLNQGFILTRALRSKYQNQSKASDALIISNVAALLKTLSPSGKKLNPMVAISMQGNLYSLGVFSLGNNIFGHLLAISLLSLWSFIQPLIIYYVIFGQQIQEMVFFYLKKINKHFPSITIENLLISYICLISFKIILGWIIVFCVHFKDEEKLNIFESKLKNIGIKNKNKLNSKKSTSSPIKGAFRDISRPLILFSFFLSFLFIYFSKGTSSQTVWLSLRPVAIAFLIFYLTRKINFDIFYKYLSTKRSKRFAQSFDQALRFFKD